MINVNEDNFEAVVMNNKKPILIDFYAPWCGPCKMMEKVLSELEIDLKEKVDFVKINIDEADKIKESHNVRAVPTFILYNNKTQVATKSGAMSKAQVMNFIESNML